MGKMTTEMMIAKATKAGGYFKFTAPRMVNGVLTPTHIQAIQRACDTSAGEKLANTATDFMFSEYTVRGRIISRKEADAILGEM